MLFPPEKITEIRERADIERIVGRSVQLARRGNRLVGLCPFHPEKTPSFGVDPQKKLFHCFGCQAGGDVFDFVMRMEALEFYDAVRFLAREVGVVLEEREEDPEQRERRERAQRLYELNEVAATFYEHELEKCEAAQKYLIEERGLTQATIAAFRLGWAPVEWQALTDHLNRKRIDLRLAQTLGLLGVSAGSNRTYDRLRGRIIFPITLPNGDIAGFGARRADWVEKDAPKYLNSPESPIYDKSSIFYGLREAKDSIRKNKRAVLVEGYLDVIGLHQAGVREAVAACGTALSARHTGLLRKLTPEVCAMYDGDAAGQDAARKASEHLLEQGLRVRVASLPDGEDPDTFARKQGEAAVRQLLEAAPGAIDFFVARAKNAYNGAGIAGMAKAVEGLRPLLVAVKDPLERDVVLDATARQLGLEPAVLRRHLTAPRGTPLAVEPSVNLSRPDRMPQADRGPPPTSPTPAKTQPVPVRPLPPPPVWELALLKRFLEAADEVLSALEAREAVRAFTHPVIQATIDAGIEALRSGNSFDGSSVLEVAAGAGADEALLGLLRKTFVDELPAKEDLAVCVKRLLKNKNTISLQRLRQQLAKETDPEALGQLAAEADRLNKLMASLS